MKKLKLYKIIIISPASGQSQTVPLYVLPILSRQACHQLEIKHPHAIISRLWSVTDQSEHP